MKRIILQSPGGVALAFGTLGVALVAVLAVSGNTNAWFISRGRPAVNTAGPGKTEPHTEAVAKVSTGTPVSQATKERIGAEVITISRFGLETTEITRPAGKFFLVIENRSGLNPITFRLNSERGEKIIEVTQPMDQLDWAGEVNPRPGHYTLTIVERPGWICDITITRP